MNVLEIIKILNVNLCDFIQNILWDIDYSRKHIRMDL